MVARRGQTTIAQTRHGFVLAAAGVDESNTTPGTVVLLPEDPDESARRLRKALRARLGVAVGVIVTDTMGRPWRAGQTDSAIGAAGVLPLRDHRGEPDTSATPSRSGRRGRRRDRRRRGPGQGQSAADTSRDRPRPRRAGHRFRRAGGAGAGPSRERGHVPARRRRRAAGPPHSPGVHRPACRHRHGRTGHLRRADRPGAASQRALAVRDRVVGGGPNRPARRHARRVDSRPAPRRIHRRPDHPPHQARPAAA